MDIQLLLYIHEDQCMQVSKWGNSLAIRLPAAIMEVLELNAGDDVEVRIADARVFEISRKPGKRDHLDRLRKFRGRLPAGFGFDRGQANERAKNVR